MKLPSRLTHGTLATLVALATLAGLAAPAAADRGVRYKNDRFGDRRFVREVRVSSGPRAYYSRSSDPGPAIAGFIGGLVIGSVIAHAQQAQACPPRYDRYDSGYDTNYGYYDPYCDRTYVSFDACAAQFRYDHRPRVVRVIEIRTGRCVGERTWNGGGWRDRGDWNGDWHDRGDWNDDRRGDDRDN